MKHIPKGIICLIGGLITAVPIVWPKLFLIGIVSFALPAYAEYTDKSERLGRSYLRGLLFFGGFGTVIFSWFCALYPLEFTGLSKAAAVAVVLAGWLGLTLLQALVWAFVFLISAKLRTLCGTASHPILYCLIFTCLYVVFEWITTKSWAAVPWGRLAIGQTEFLLMLQIASLVGGYGVSFVLVLFGSAVGVALAESRAGRPKRGLRTLALAAAVLASGLTFGLCRGLLYEMPEDSEAVTVAAVQGNVSSHDKWTEDSLGITESRYRSMTLAAASEGAEIVVFPETPITYNIDGASSYAVRGYYERLARESGCTVITGVFTKNGNGESENSVMAVSPENGFLPEKYVKRHLVPFGEYVPMRGFVSAVFPPLSDISMLENDLAAGSEATLLDTEHGKIAPLICFDSIYETLAADSVRAGGELITLSTNDSWFLDSDAVWEHNRHAVLRSVECGRYTVRAANTGVSSVISPVGEIIDMLPPLCEGYIVAEVGMISENTVYTCIGNLFIPLCALGAVLCAVISKKRLREDVSR